MKVTVVGGGVIGLTCAWRLATAGHTVTVWTADDLPETTSAVAGGLVYPHLVGPPARVRAWTATTLDVFRELAADDTAGVRILPGRMLYRSPQPWPEWADVMPELKRLTGLTPPYRDGFTFTAPVVNMSRYLGWLLARVTDTGAIVQSRRAESLRQAGHDADVVVNAAGLGARELAADPSLVPVRGQVVRTANPGLTEWVLDEDHPDGATYVIPHADHVVCGGTTESGAFDTTPDLATAAAILARCRAVVPALVGATVRSHAAGLRPYRGDVRLECVDDVVHCYGHGGAGVTLSWGCADEVTRLVA